MHRLSAKKGDRIPEFTKASAQFITYFMRRRVKAVIACKHEVMLTTRTHGRSSVQRSRPGVRCRFYSSHISSLVSPFSPWAERRLSLSA